MMKRMILVMLMAIGCGNHFLQQTRAADEGIPAAHNVTVQVLMFHGSVDVVHELFPDPLGPGRTVEVPETTLKRIRAFELEKKIAVMARPQIMTVSGAQAQIRLVLEKIYPTEYSQAEVNSGSGSTGIIGTTPSSFRTREIGTLMNVTPTVVNDAKVISVTIIPEKSEFQGMKPSRAKIIEPTQAKKGGDQDMVEVNTTPKTIQTAAVEVEQPDFTSVNLTTTMQVASGRPIVLAASNPPPEQKSIPLDHIVVIIMTATASLPGGVQ